MKPEKGCFVCCLRQYFMKGGSAQLQKIICKREYDTETATLVKKYSVGNFGDPAGYEETLYQTPDGYYFLYVCGGETSPYVEEDIQMFAKTKVKAWIESH